MCSCVPNVVVGERRAHWFKRNVSTTLFSNLKGKLDLSLERLKSRKGIVGRSFLLIELTDDRPCASIINNF